MKNKKFKVLICIFTVAMWLMSFAPGLAQETGADQKESQTFAAPGFQDSHIQAIYVGSSQYGNGWRQIELSYNNGRWSATVPAYGSYYYVKVRMMNWGFPHDSQYERLDGKKPDGAWTVGYYDYFGKPCRPGSTVYGVSSDLIFRIPADVPSSIYSALYYKNRDSKRIFCDITWDRSGEATAVTGL